MKIVSGIIIWIFSAGIAQAQAPVPMKIYGHDWYLSIPKKSGEQAEMVCNQYNVPEYLFTELNTQLPSRHNWQVPLGIYNRSAYAPSSKNSAPIFYINEKLRDELTMSIYLKTSMAQLRTLNNGNTNFKVGDTVWAGYLLQNLSPQYELPITEKGDNSTAVLNDFHQQFLNETFNETVLQSQRGPVAFYYMRYSKKGVFYAFHNDAAKGSIIKIINPSNQRAVFAKVLGQVPSNAQYHNCLLGLSNNAMSALGISNEKKLWCELQFAGY